MTAKELAAILSCHMETPLKGEQVADWEKRNAAILEPIIDREVNFGPDEPPRITCVYCGHHYPMGTPTSHAEILKQHIAVCQKHPMAEMRQALVLLVGADGREELEELRSRVLGLQISPNQKLALARGIKSLYETLPKQ